MGQGSYVAYVWGTILDEESPLSIAMSEEEGDLWEFLVPLISPYNSYAPDRGQFWQLKHWYESAERWIGFFVADNDGTLCTDFNCNETDAEARFPTLDWVVTNRTFRASDLLATLEANTSRLDECRMMWSAFAERLASSPFQIKLSLGELLIVHDWH